MFFENVAGSRVTLSWTWLKYCDLKSENCGLINLNLLKKSLKISSRGSMLVGACRTSGSVALRMHELFCRFCCPDCVAWVASWGRNAVRHLFDLLLLFVHMISYVRRNPLNYWKNGSVLIPSSLSRKRRLQLYGIEGLCRDLGDPEIATKIISHFWSTLYIIYTSTRSVRAQQPVCAIVGYDPKIQANRSKKGQILTARISVS